MRQMQVKVLEMASCCRVRMVVEEEGVVVPSHQRFPSTLATKETLVKSAAVNDIKSEQDCFDGMRS